MNWPYINYQFLYTDYYLFININLLYMFRASSAHLQEDTIVHMQHMVLLLSMRFRGGLSVHSLSGNSWLYINYQIDALIIIYS